MSRNRVRKPHLFSIKDVYRVLKAVRGDLYSGRMNDKILGFYVLVFWELLKQITYTQSWKDENYGYFRNLIAYSMRYDPDYLASKLVFSIIREPPAIKSVGDTMQIVEFILGR